MDTNSDFSVFTVYDGIYVCMYNYRSSEELPRWPLPCSCRCLYRGEEAKRHGMVNGQGAMRAIGAMTMFVPASRALEGGCFYVWMDGYEGQRYEVDQDVRYRVSA